MWLGSKFTLLSDSLFKSLFRFLFRYDVFISYARSDGKEYALKLRDQLKQLDFSCFLDYDELPAGNSLSDTLKRAIRKSATLVVVGTERATKSRYVELEVGEFTKTGRAIIPIDMEGTLAEVPWQIVKERDIVWVDELKTALDRGVPSPNVADSIDKLFKYTRRNSRVRAQVFATIILFVLIVAVSLLLIRQQVKAASLASAEAKTERALADDANLRAVSKEKDAKKAEEKAEASERRAAGALKEASDAAKKAKEQESLALTNAERAKAEQAKAEERTRYIDAQQIGVQADIDIDTGDDLERSVLLSVESLKRAFTPDGYIGWARGMDLLPHAAEVKFTQQQDNVTAIAYSPDGHFFAEGAGDGAVLFFESDKTEPIKRHLQSENKIKVITFGKDWVAAASQNEFKMWNLRGFAEIRSSQTLNGFYGESIAFSPDGRYVATGGSVSNKAVLRVFDTTNPTKKIQTRLEYVGYVMSVAFSPDGKWLAIGCQYNNYKVPLGKRNACDKADHRPTVGKVLVLDVANFEKGIEVAGNPITSVTEEELIYRINFGPKGKHLATEDVKGTVRIWQVIDDDGHIEMKPSQAPKMRIGSLEVVRVGVAKGGGLNFANNSVGRATLVFDPEESYVATAPDEHTARVWEVSTGREMSRIIHEQAVEAIAFGPAGQFATTSGKVKFWKTEFGSEAKRLPYENESPGVVLHAMAVSRGGEWLATGKDDGVAVYRTTDWSQIARLRQADHVSKLTFSPDGQWLIAARQNKLTLIETTQWKARELALLSGDQQSSEVSAMGFSPNSQWLVTTYGTFIKLFAVKSWRETPAIATSNSVSKLAFSPDSRRLAAWIKGRASISARAFGPDEIFVWETSGGMPVACRDDKGAQANASEQSLPYVCPSVQGAKEEVLLSEVRKWKEPLELNLISNTSPDGRWSVENDNGIQLKFNEGEIYREVAKLVKGSSPSYWTFTPDSRWLAIAVGDTVAIWPLVSAGMIEAACARLRRHELTDKEWNFSDKRLQPCSLTQP